MGASGKRHLGALRDDTSKSAGSAALCRAPSPQSRLLNFSYDDFGYSDLRALFLAALLPACHRVVTSLRSGVYDCSNLATLLAKSSA